MIEPSPACIRIRWGIGQAVSEQDRKQFGATMAYSTFVGQGKNRVVVVPGERNTDELTPFWIPEFSYHYLQSVALYLCASATPLRDGVSNA